jgi:hypothetical protein
VELAAVIIAGLALAVAVWSVLDSRASARRSASEADRSAIASERSAAAAEREIEIATAYRDPWRLQQDSGSAYRLFNNSDETAEAVTLTCGTSAQSSIIVETQSPDVQPHSAIPFTYARGYGAAETLTVTWRRPGEDTPHTWEWCQRSAPH